jgi:four helix bundle protein
MFDFEKLTVYIKSKSFNIKVGKLLKTLPIDTTTRNQLRRASMSVLLNIAEGSGRNSKADKRHFFVMSRGSVFECVAIFDLMKEEEILTEQLFQEFYKIADELSRMLYAMIQKLQ